MTIWKGLPKLLDAFLRDLCTNEVQSFESCQPLESLYIPDLCAAKYKRFDFRKSPEMFQDAIINFCRVL